MVRKSEVYSSKKDWSKEGKVHFLRYSYKYYTLSDCRVDTDQFFPASIDGMAEILARHSPQAQGEVEVREWGIDYYFEEGTDPNFLRHRI